MKPILEDIFGYCVQNRTGSQANVGGSEGNVQASEQLDEGLKATHVETDLTWSAVMQCLVPKCWLLPCLLHVVQSCSLVPG